jgi:hypothetical protein
MSALARLFAEAHAYFRTGYSHHSRLESIGIMSLALRRWKDGLSRQVIPNHQIRNPHFQIAPTNLSHFGFVARPFIPGSSNFCFLLAASKAACWPAASRFSSPPPVTSGARSASSFRSVIQVCRYSLSCSGTPADLASSNKEVARSSVLEQTPTWWVSTITPHM